MLLKFVLAMALSATALPAITQPAPPPPLAYPATRTVDHVDTYHGTRVPDPYRWLEDDNAADTRAWVQAQNAVTEQALSAMPQRQPVRQLYTRLFDFERYGVPFKEGGRYFWTRNDGLQQQAVLYTATSLTAPPTVALDPNRFSKDGTVALTGTVPSRDGRLLAYGTASAGSDWQTWRVRDLATGADLPDTLEWVKFSTASWTPDGRGFFYARYDAPAPGAKLSGTNVFQKLYYHRLGTPQSADVLVADNPADKAWGFGSSVSDDGRMVFINVWKGSARRNGLMLLPLKDGAFVPARPQPLTLAFDAQYVPLALTGQRLVLRTNHGAPNGRLVSVDLQHHLDRPEGSEPVAPQWQTVVAETGDAMVGASAVGGRFVLSYLRDASTLVRLQCRRRPGHPRTGPARRGHRQRLRRPLGRRRDLLQLHQPDHPGRHLPAERRHRRGHAVQAPGHGLRPRAVRDAARLRHQPGRHALPVFIGHRKGLVPDGSNATLLHGYGGFNVPNTPGYNVTAATWMQMGGVYVSASIRGGGEYGRAWHEAGTKLRKQNVFDDFIAAAEWLVREKITRPSKLAIYGGSNGGLLVGAVLNQRPELFGAAVPAVGVMDMLRFHKFTIGWAWVDDYGSSDDPEQFKALKAYSPLHNLAAGKRYPPVLVMTADHDDRVVPAHSFKYAAALQATDTGPAQKIIRIETDAGHGAGKPSSKAIAERSDMLAFIAHHLGLAVRSPGP